MLRDLERGTSCTAERMPSDHHAGRASSQQRDPQTAADTSASAHKRPRARSRATKRKGDAPVSNPQLATLAEEHEVAKEPIVSNVSHVTASSVNSTALEAAAEPSAVDVQDNNETDGWHLVTSRKSKSRRAKSVPVSAA